MGNDTEEWRWIPGHEGDYEVSNMGRVRSWKRWTKEPPPRLMTGSPVGFGYLTVSLNSRPRTIHGLVLAAFVGPLPKGMVTRHLNGDPTDNRLVNLAYGTYLENAHDRLAHGNHYNVHKDRCPQGHPYDEANTYVYVGRNGRTRRNCRACGRISAKRRRELPA